MEIQNVTKAVSRPAAAEPLEAGRAGGFTPHGIDDDHRGRGDPADDRDSLVSLRDECQPHRRRGQRPARRPAVRARRGDQGRTVRHRLRLDGRGELLRDSTDWQSGWIVFSEPDQCSAVTRAWPRPSCCGPERILEHRHFHCASNAQSTITFNRDGYAIGIANGTLITLHDSTSIRAPGPAALPSRLSGEIIDGTIRNRQQRSDLHMRPHGLRAVPAPRSTARGFTLHRGHGGALRHRDRAARDRQDPGARLREYRHPPACARSWRCRRRGSPRACMPIAATGRDFAPSPSPSRITGDRHDSAMQGQPLADDRHDALHRIAKPAPATRLARTTGDHGRLRLAHLCDGAERRCSAIRTRSRRSVVRLPAIARSPVNCDDSGHLERKGRVRSTRSAPPTQYDRIRRRRSTPTYTLYVEP